MAFSLGINRLGGDGALSFEPLSWSLQTRYPSLRCALRFLLASGKSSHASVGAPNPPGQSPPFPCVPTGPHLAGVPRVGDAGCPRGPPSSPCVAGRGGADYGGRRARRWGGGDGAPRRTGRPPDPVILKGSSIIVKREKPDIPRRPI